MKGFEDWPAIFFCWPRGQNITASGYLVTQFLNDAQYRAWGTLKSVGWGNGITESAGYNNRLQMTSRQILQVSGQPGVSSSYQYYADGQLKFSHSADERFDRAYSYDHAARATEAYSGSEARDYVNGTNSGAPTGAYRQSYQYNALSEVSQQTNRLWSQTRTTINTFVNNRLQGWSYDADGELTHDDTTTYTRDAANRIVAAAGGGSSSAVKYDGDGLMIWRQLHVPSNPPSTQTSYYLNSSILGLAVAELNASGQKTVGHVYAGGRKIADAGVGYVAWSHTEPVTGSNGESYENGFYTPTAEFNADGVNVGLVDPASVGGDIADPFSHKGALGLSYGCSTGDCITCFLDGFEHDCGQMSYLFDIGVAGQCPDNNCGPRFSHDRNGKPILVPLTWDPGTGQLGWKDWERRHNDPNGADEDDRIYFGSYFWAPVWHYADAAIFGFLGMGFGFGPPQNTSESRVTPDQYLSLRKEMGKALQSKDCRDFIDRLISYNQGGMHYDSEEDFLAFSDYIYNSPEGGIFFRGGHGGQLGTKFWLGDAVYFRLNTVGYAATLMHLLIHGLQRPGGSDDQLDRDIRKLGIVPIDRNGKPLEFPTGMRDGKPFNDWSEYWDRALHNACFPNSRL